MKHNTTLHSKTNAEPATVLHADKTHYTERSDRQFGIIFKAVAKDMFADCLRFFYPECDQIYDMAHYEFLNDKIGSLLDTENADLADSYDDLVAKIYKKGLPGEWDIIHIAIQETEDEAFSEHMFQYDNRIRQIYNVPVKSIAIITGDSPTVN